MPIGIFRLPNLLIVAATQYLLQYLVLAPSLEKAGLYPTLDNWHFFLFVLTTLCITAGGYLINDLLDYETDLINKPDKVFINSKFSKRRVIVLYWLLNLAGLSIAWLLALFVHHPGWVLIYPFAVLGLWLYSRYFKKLPLIGNLVVAFFCAGVPGIILFAEEAAFRKMLTSNPGLAIRSTLVFGGYVLFAFYATLLREIIKDMEDWEGDAKAGLRTLPIAFGLGAAKKAALFFAILLGVMLFIFSYWLRLNGEWTGLLFNFTAIILPLGYLVLQLWKAEQKQDFSRLSLLAKLIMAAGLVLLVLISF